MKGGDANRRILKHSNFIFIPLIQIFNKIKILSANISLYEYSFYYTW
jgi:hypothetical protein